MAFGSSAFQRNALEPPSPILLQFYHKMMQNAYCTKNVVLLIMTNAVLKEIEGKLTMHQKVPKWDHLPIFLVGFDHYLVRFAHFPRTIFLV